MKIIDETGKSKGPYLSVTGANVVDGYRVRITFNDGTSRIVDFGPFLHGAWQSWITKYRNLREFKKFKIAGGNLNWNDYELIFPLADLYRGTIEYESVNEYASVKKANMVPKAGSRKRIGRTTPSLMTLEVPLPAPMVRRLKARAKKEDVPLELLVQRYLETSMRQQSNQA